MSGAGVKGTIDFRHDTVNDIVVTRPRWTLDSSVEVMRWYQMHASYFGARFQDRKDVIVINDAFDVLPKVAALWGQYRAKLHETYIRYSVRVNNNPRVRLSTNTSAARYTISALETPTLEAAIAAILAARAEAGDTPSPRRYSSSTSVPPPSSHGSMPAAAPVPLDARGSRPSTPFTVAGSARGRTDPPASARISRPGTLPPLSAGAARPTRTQPPASKGPPKAPET